jgi:hypothetical protein
MREGALVCVEAHVRHGTRMVRDDQLSRVTGLRRLGARDERARKHQQVVRDR